MNFIDERLLDRFVSKIEFTDTCWLWTGGVNHGGYGKFWANGATHAVHRFSYELFRGLIPDGLTIDHLCRVRCCVLPDHLEAVTIQENLLRSPLRPEARTHCPQGHPYAGHNLLLKITTRKGKERLCRTCKNNHGREYQREYQRRPDIRDRTYQYRQRPEVKERRRLYQQAYRARNKEVASCASGLE